MNKSISIFFGDKFYMNRLFLIGLITISMGLFYGCGKGKEKENTSDSNLKSTNQNNYNTIKKYFQLYDKALVDISTLKNSSYQEFLFIDYNSYIFSNLSKYCITRLLNKFLIPMHTQTNLRWENLTEYNFIPLEISGTIPILTERHEDSSFSKILEAVVADASRLSGVNINTENWTSFLREIVPGGSISKVFAFKKDDAFQVDNLNLALKVHMSFNNNKDFGTLKREIFSYNLIKQLAPLAKIIIKNEQDFESLENFIEVVPVSYDKLSLGNGIKRQILFDEFEIPIEKIQNLLTHFVYDGLNPEEEILTMGFKSTQEALLKIMALMDFYISTQSLIAKYLKDNEIVSNYNKHIVGFDMNNRNVFWSPTKKVFVILDF